MMTDPSRVLTGRPNHVKILDMTNTAQTTGTMLADRGADYVTAWPAALARKHGLTHSDVITALNLMTGSDVDPATPAETFIAEVGVLTAEQARKVAGQVAYQVRLRELADLERRAPHDPAARARLAGWEHGVNGEVWDEG